MSRNGARVLHNTRAQGALMALADSPDGVALRETFTTLMGFPAANRYLAGMVSGLDIRYGDSEHPLTGARIPDHDLAGGGRLFERMRAGDWLTVQRSEAPELAAEAALVRPDGYVHWAGEPDGLQAATATRFGAAAVAA